MPGSHIGVVYRLPDNWNGKLLGLGGGTWHGNVSLKGFSGAFEGLQRGYATLQTDSGHYIGGGDTDWALDAEGEPDMVAITDFGERAIHEMTVIGKLVAEKYYGHVQSESFFQGCSTGGRQAMMETQRYPADYDGLIAGSPVYSLRALTTSIIRVEEYADTARRLSPAQLKLVSDAVMAACDGADRSKDGVLMDPRKCQWDPGVLACKTGETGDQCLSAPQIDGLRALYAGVTTKDGRPASYSMPRGAEASIMHTFGITSDQPAAPPPRGGGGIAGLNKPLYGDANFDLSKFDPNTDVTKVESSDFAKVYDASDPDLSGLVAHGGKLILWDGFDDPYASPFAVINYLAAAQKVSANGKLADSVRLFIAPGVNHCGGGEGANTIDTLTAIENWVEKGEAPKSIVATRADKKLSWPLCPFPALPHYKGKGALDDPRSYSCK